MVARHEMPGNASSREPSLRVRYDPLATAFDCLRRNKRGAENHTVPYGTVPVLPVFQAFYAWLPSFRPSGTKPNVLPRRGCAAPASNVVL